MAKIDRVPGMAQTAATDLAAVGARVADITAVTLTATAPAAQTSADTTAITAAAGEATAADLTLTQALQVDYDKAVADITELRTKLAATIVDVAALNTQFNLVRAALDEFNISA